MTRSTRLYHHSSIAERNETDSDPIIVSVANQMIPEYLKMQNISNLEEPKKRPLFSMTLRKTENISKQTFDDSSIKQNAQLLPTCFNLKTKSQWAELEPGNLQVSYSGLGKGAEIDPGTVKGNYAIPPSCGIYYYEVKIMSKGRDGYIGVGFTTSTATQQRLPGIWLFYILRFIGKASMKNHGVIMQVMGKNTIQIILESYMDQHFQRVKIMEILFIYLFSSIR